MTSSDAPALRRSSARVLLVDDVDRLLLFSSVDKGVTRWYAVSGGLRKDETYEQAAIREVWEETGLARVSLSRAVWRGRPWTTLRDGVTIEVQQCYFFARVPSFTVDTSRFEPLERSTVTGIAGGPLPN